MGKKAKTVGYIIAGAALVSVGYVAAPNAEAAPEAVPEAVPEVVTETEIKQVVPNVCADALSASDQMISNYEDVIVIAGTVISRSGGAIEDASNYNAAGLQEFTTFVNDKHEEMNGILSDIQGSNYHELRDKCLAIDMGGDTV